jgi:hypothetical protein
MSRCSFPDEAISSESYWCCRVSTANTNLIPAGALGRPDFPLNAPADLKCKKCASLRHDYPGLDNNSFEHMVCGKDSCYHVNFVDAVTCGNPKCDAKLPNHPLGTRVVFVGRTKCLATFLSKKENEYYWLCTKCNRISTKQSLVCRADHGKKWKGSKACEGMRDLNGICVVRLKTDN